MKTYKERTNAILEKVNTKKKQRKRRITVASTLCACVIAVGCYLFIPIDNTPPNVDEYKANEYYDVIAKLNEAIYEKPGYNNNFDAITGTLDGVLEDALDGALDKYEDAVGGTASDVGIMEGDVDLNYGATDNIILESTPESSTPSPDKENYQETTDNQVAGVIEGDRIKRSSKYIYYMNSTTLSIYTIDGENSTKAGSFVVEDKDQYKLSAYQDQWEMFLSKDCSTITIISTCYNYSIGETFVCLINLDVTDPSNVQETERTYLSGAYLSSRLVEDEILLISHYNLGNDIDFEVPSTFVPQYGTCDDKECVPGENIVTPEKLTTTSYTVVAKIDQKTLDQKSTGAFLSYTNNIYVSSEKIYATRHYYSEDKLPNFNDSCEAYDSYRFQSVWTEISAMDYSGDTLIPAGSVTVEGTINNQYNLDEYEGVLRIVTTTDAFIIGYVDTPVSSYDSISYGESIINELTGRNASLSCIDLSTWEVIASVERFAPRGESVQSVRFDKDKAYVCTAIVLTDPVFVFDLSDLNNITYKDTGTITGYSSSLVNFGDGYLLGIGYGASFDTLKLEIYTETATGVDSVCSYEVPHCYFASEYKSYYINRDKHLIGIGYDTYENTDESGFNEHYTLFLFDGYDFVKVIDEEIIGVNNFKRAVLIDEYFYMFGENFAVKTL